MKKNKFTTYLLYAVGEIVLVVIGILIAVNINNWNERRKQEAIELKLLHEIKLNLIDSKSQISLLAKNQKSSANSYRLVLNHLEEGGPYHDSLAYYFVNLSYFFSPQLTSASYETLKQKGMDMIQNDSLKLSVIRMYEVIFKLISEDMDRAEWVYSQAVVQPFFAANFQIADFNKSDGPQAFPNNYETLRRDPKFRNILAQLRTIREVGALNAEYYAEEVEDLISKLDKELVSRGFTNKQ